MRFVLIYFINTHYLFIGSGEYGNLFVSGQYQHTDDEETLQVNIDLVKFCVTIVFIYRLQKKR